MWYSLMIYMDYDMSLQAYIENITAKTGKTSEQISEEATRQGILTEDMKATNYHSYHPTISCTDYRI